MKFKPSSNCIYCGKKGVTLDKEHIIPFGLGGQWVMPSASCKNCAKITSQLELLVLRKMYLPLRTKAEFPTRDKKTRPKSFKATIKKTDGSIQVIDVPISVYPTIYPIIQLPQPGILNNTEINNTNDSDIKITLTGNQEEMNAFAAAYPDAIEFNFSWELSINALIRVLAKIAHSFTVSLYGTTGYTPLLPSLILGNHTNPSYLVGGLAHLDEPRDKKISDGLEIVITNEGYIIVNIDVAGGRLPTYSAVTGKVHEWEEFINHVSYTGVEDKKEHDHGMRTRFMYIHEWVIWLIQIIRHFVERDHPDLVKYWPLINRYSFDAYALPPRHYLVILKSSSDSIPSGPNVALKMPYSDHPNLPPNKENLGAWQEWCRSSFSLSDDQWSIILPVHDLGKTHNVNKESELFSEEEKEFWVAQINNTIMMQLSKAMRNSRDDKPEYAHGMRTRFMFFHEWMIKFVAALRFYVERNFPDLKAQWPLLSGYSFDAYAMPPGHYLLILKSTNEAIPSGPDGAVALPYCDHPKLPPSSADLGVWKQWCQNRLSISSNQWPILLPAHDSGRACNVDKDYELFSKNDKEFWDAQLQYTIRMQLNEVLEMLQRKAQ
ncbi:MAG: hypothetical protein JSR32_03675 [Proteobacteria bacterium]|nr:hypothetical protein [Pseudomonadota bacterium]